MRRSMTRLTIDSTTEVLPIVRFSRTLRAGGWPGGKFCTLAVCLKPRFGVFLPCPPPKPPWPAIPPTPRLNADFAGECPACNRRCGQPQRAAECPCPNRKSPAAIVAPLVCCGELPMHCCGRASDARVKVRRIRLLPAPWSPKKTLQANHEAGNAGRKGGGQSGESTTFRLKTADL